MGATIKIVSPEAGPKRRLASDAGVTLIELLVVVAVLSVLAVGVTLSAGRAGSAGQSDATAFQGQFEAARSLAVHSGQAYGLTLGPKGRRMERRVAGDWEILGPERRWQGRVGHNLRGPQPYEAGPDILFLSNGQTSAFDITFSGRGGATAIRCHSDGWTGIECDAG